MDGFLSRPDLPHSQALRAGLQIITNTATTNRNATVYSRAGTCAPFSGTVVAKSSSRISFIASSPTAVPSGFAAKVECVEPGGKGCELPATQEGFPRPLELCKQMLDGIEVAAMECEPDR